MFDLLKLLFCTPFLVYGCYTDWLTRRVPNRVWLWMLPGAVVFFFFDAYAVFPWHVIWTLVAAGGVYVVFSAVNWISSRLGVVPLGGADVKALLMIAFIFPLYPSFSLDGFVFPLLGVPVLPVFVVSVFYNAVILNALVFPLLFLWNLWHAGFSEFLRHPLLFFIGYQVHVEDLSVVHARLLENYVEDGAGLRRVFSLRGTPLTDEVRETLRSLVREGRIGERVWVMPGIPFFIPLTLGFLTAALLGDILFSGLLHLYLS